jgi:hypothetical protein
MKTRVLLLAAMLTTVLACKKNSDNETVTPPPSPIGETVDVRLQFAGDITTGESPLGRKVIGGIENARTLIDSTIYDIVVYKDGKGIYEGLFNYVDSVVLKIPTTGTIKVEAIAMKRGTGPGLYYAWISSNGNLVQRYHYPGVSVITNRMDTVAPWYYTNMPDTLMNIPLFDGADTTQMNSSTHAALDSYRGSVTFNANATPAVITLPMRRLSFGIKYNVSNFTAGRLIANYGWSMPIEYLTPVNAATQQFIYTAYDFQWRDSLYLNPVTVNLQWEKADGSKMPLGQKTIYFKRNVLTTLNVTIPSTGPVVNPVPTDTVFTGNQNINF